jgi:hypothetical protein
MIMEAAGVVPRVAENLRRNVDMIMEAAGVVPRVAENLRHFIDLIAGLPA